MAPFLVFFCSLIINVITADIIEVNDHLSILDHVDVQTAIEKAGSHDDSWKLWLVMRSWEFIIILAMASVCVCLFCYHMAKHEVEEEQDHEPLLVPRDEDFIAQTVERMTA